MKSAIRKLAGTIPGVLPFVRSIYEPVRSLRRRINATRKARELSTKNTEQVFTEIYTSRSWKKGRETVSGGGSDLDQTEWIRNELPAIFSELHVGTMLDIPCGDFWWMKQVDLGGISYIGADIVHGIVDSNRKYEKANISFRHLDLIRDELPKVDLVFVRDCLVHFSNNDIFMALQNIVNSESGYLLTTTFTDRGENTDIATGQWRSLNLQKSPFSLPEPIKVICEHHHRRQYADKSLALWDISEISKALKRVAGRA